MEMIFQAHSGVRFLVLLAAVVAAALLLAGSRTGQPLGGAARKATAAFTGLLDLQILLGIATLMVRPFYGALIGHLVMMAAAAMAAHGLSVYARKQPDPRRVHLISLAGIVLALLLIVGGIMSIRPSPFYMTPAGESTSAT
jgi:hypothetical protein